MQKYNPTGKLRQISVKELECRTCHYRWFPRIDKANGEVRMPKNCPDPKCKSPYWNVPYSRK